MHAQLITYTPANVSQTRYLTDFIEPFTDYFEKLEALVTKVWLTSDGPGQHGGFYVWKDKDAMDAFMASPVVADILSRLYITDVTSVDWPINIDSSVRTRGLVASDA